MVKTAGIHSGVFFPFLTFFVGYLDVNEQIEKVSGRHDDRRVQRGDVTLIQTQIQVSGQTLEGDMTNTYTERVVSHCVYSCVLLFNNCLYNPVTEKARAYFPIVCVSRVQHSPYRANTFFLAEKKRKCSVFAWRGEKSTQSSENF